ncbi:MAG: hypothetical protein ACLP8S_09070, partial [Solirubrobacteraceae bacterium]
PPSGTWPPVPRWPRQLARIPRRPGRPPIIGGIAQITSLRLACGLLALASLVVVGLARSAESELAASANYRPVTV